MKKTDLSSWLVDYSANMITQETFIRNAVDPMLTEPINEREYNEISNILGEFNRDWESAPCDAEGATPEQEHKLDLILQKAENEILSVVIHKII